MLILCQKSEIFKINYHTLGEIRDLGMEHVDSINFMLKSTFCRLSIDDPLIVHS